MAEHRVSLARILALSGGCQTLGGVSALAWIVVAVAVAFGYVPIVPGYRRLTFRTARPGEVLNTLWVAAILSACFLIWLAFAWHRAQRMVSRAQEVTGRVASVRNQAGLREFYVRWHDSSGAARTEWIAVPRDALPFELLRVQTDQVVGLLIDPATPDRPKLLAMYVARLSTEKRG